MTAWSDLLATALLGTDRRATGGDDPGGDLLDRAAAWAAYRRAGVRPGTGVEPAVEPGRSAPIDPVPRDAAPIVPDGAAARLARLLDGEGLGMDVVSRGAVLDEWLAAAAAGGLLVPPNLLPALLEHGVRRRDLREPIAAVGGARARWLAELNPQWAYLTEAADESISDDSLAWSMGTSAQRTGYLRAARRRDPVAARELLEGQWPALTPDERGELLATLATGLDPSDEPLLERTLDDRRREVRAVAAELLAALPGSRYNQRMIERAVAFVRVSTSEVSVRPPAECDKAMQRDGIAPKPPAGLGERAWWLEEVLARTPLEIWRMAPAEFAGQHIDEAWADTVHRGLARAAAGQRRPDWASVLLDLLGRDAAAPHRDASPHRDDSPHRDAAAHRRNRECAAALYPVLDAADLVERAVDALTQGRTHVWGLSLANCPPPWPAPLAQAVLAGLTSLAGEPKLAGDLYQLCRLAAVRLPPECAPEARDRARLARESEPHSARLRALDSLADLLTFRHEMIQELT
jgi:hypothetical protein